MVLAAALLAGAVVAASMGPRALFALHRRGSDPGLGIASWLIAMLSVIATAASGLILVLVPGHGAGSALGAVVNNCWATLRHGQIPRLDEIVGALGGIGVALAVARLAWVAARGARLRRRRCRDHLDALALVGQADAEGTVWIPSAHPAAFCLSGPRRVVVATTGLDGLPESARAAVLAHERAHLAGRHHLLLAVVDAIAATAPGLPLFRSAPAAVRELVELAADRRAARRCGTPAVKAALLAAGRFPSPPDALAMRTDASVAGRLAALDGAPHQRGPTATLQRCLRRLTVSFTALLGPTLTAAALAGSLALVSCS